MVEDKSDQKADTKSDAPITWTCSVCGGHYLIMPVIAKQEYSVDNDTGQEFWGDVDSESEPDFVFVEEKKEYPQTHAFCKTCEKETLCLLKPFEPAKIPGPNLIKDVYNVNDENIKSVGTLPDDSIIK